MNLFSWNSLDSILEINKPELVLIKEFKNLLSRDTSKDKSRFYRELTYIYLMIDWKSPYADYSDLERHEAALSDSELTAEEFEDTIFKNACKKYQDIQKKDIKMQAVQSAQFLVHRIIDYFDNIVDFEKVNENGMPIYKMKDVMIEMRQLGNVLDELDALKIRIKKGLASESDLRAGAVEGFLPKLD